MNEGKPDQSSIREGVARVSERLNAAARRAGRDPSEITLIGVTKTMSVDVIQAAIASGLTHLGENRVQEAASKIGQVAGPPGSITWHLIGHLQSNKANRAVELFAWIHSLDRVDLARRLNRRAGHLGARRQVLIQVDLGHEPTKHGVDSGQLRELAEEVASLPNLDLKGLMTVPPWFEDPESSRPFFNRLRLMRDHLATQGTVLPDLSMGMTGDFEVAVEEGATLVRVGRAIFGERPQTK